MKVLTAFFVLVVCACASLASAQVISLQKCDVTYEVDANVITTGNSLTSRDIAQEDVKFKKMLLEKAKFNNKPAEIAAATKALQSAELKLKAAQAAAALDNSKVDASTPAGLLKAYRAAKRPWTLDGLIPLRKEFSPLRRYVTLDNPILESRLLKAWPNCLGSHNQPDNGWRSAFAKYGNRNYGRTVWLYFEDALSLLDAAAAKCDAFVKAGSAPGVTLSKFGRCEVAIVFDQAAKKWSVKK